jgi:hypothetical protein
MTPRRTIVGKDSTGRVMGPTQRPLPDNTQHLEKADIHFPGGFRFRIPSKRAAVDPDLKQRGHWNRLNTVSKLRKLQTNK